MPTENREGQLPKTRSKAIGKRVRVGHGDDTVLLDRVHRIQGARRLTGKDGRARSECLCRETETGEQASTADWRQHDVEIGNLIDKLDHHRLLTGYHERIVKRVDHDRLIVIHEFTQPCISIAPIFNHVHLSPIAQNRMMLHGRKRFGHHDMCGGP